MCGEEGRRSGRAWTHPCKVVGPAPSHPGSLLAHVLEILADVGDVRILKDLTVIIVIAIIIIIIVRLIIIVLILVAESLVVRVGPRAGKIYYIIVYYSI